MATRACFYINQTVALFKASKLTESEKANERYALNVQRMVKSHIHLVVYLMAKEYVSNHEFKDPVIKGILHLLIKVFAVKMIMADTQGLYECKYFSSDS